MWPSMLLSGTPSLSYLCSLLCWQDLVVRRFCCSSTKPRRSFRVKRTTTGGPECDILLLIQRSHTAALMYMRSVVLVSAVSENVEFSAPHNAILTLFYLGEEKRNVRLLL